jgi:hypothetical protein
LFFGINKLTPGSGPVRRFTPDAGPVCPSAPPEACFRWGLDILAKDWASSGAMALHAVAPDGTCLVPVPDSGRSSSEPLSPEQLEALIRQIAPAWGPKSVDVDF